MLKAFKIQKQGKLRISIIKPFDENIANNTAKRTSKWKQKKVKNAFVLAVLESVCTVWMIVI